MIANKFMIKIQNAEMVAWKIVFLLPNTVARDQPFIETMISKMWVLC